MSNAFNPFAAPATAQPAVQQPVGALPVYQAPQAPAQPMPTQPAQGFGGQQPQRAIPNSMNDAESSDGFTTPRMRHIEAELDVKITKYFGHRGEIKGRCCNIIFEVMASNNPAVPVGSEWRIQYQYNYDHSEKSEADTWGRELQKLTGFIRALFGKECKDLRAAERSLHAHGAQELGRTPVDFAVTPAYLHLSCTLSAPKDVTDKKTGAKTTKQFRNDLWMPARRVA